MATAKKEKKVYTETDYKILLKKKSVGFSDIMELPDDFFTRFVIEKGFAEWLAEACDRTEEVKVYPRVKKYNPELKKYTYQKDTEAEFETVEKPITSFTIRSAFCKECLSVAKKAPAEKKPDWRVLMKERAEKAM